MEAKQRNEPAASHTADDARAFEHRGTLLRLAYRMLGSRAEAEDAVQDTFVRWHQADRSEILNDAAWLTTTCTRRCIDVLRRAERTRLDFSGARLPEHVHTTAIVEDECTLSSASSLSAAFLLMLERLSPKERAAFLLHDIFDLSYGHIAETLGLDATACRKLVSRARLSIGQPKARVEPPPLAHREELLSAFREAIETGDPLDFSAMLADARYLQMRSSS
jgi:RNA polymerase sigma-70 factor (ECF subfamily)